MMLGLFSSFMLVLGMTQVSAQNAVPSRDAHRGPGTPPAPVKSPEVAAPPTS
jgi:hypothetical protein